MIQNFASPSRVEMGQLPIKLWLYNLLKYIWFKMGKQDIDFWNILQLLQDQFSQKYVFVWKFLRKLTFETVVEGLRSQYQMY